MKKTIVGLSILSIFFFFEGKAQSLGGLSKKGTEVMDQAKNAVNSGSAAAMLSEMKSKLRLKSTQVSQIRPEIEKYVKERKDLETSKMADQAKLKSMKVLNESFDGKIKAVLSKIQWTKYLEWIRKFRG